jgi:hypothetical protein
MSSKIEIHLAKTQCVLERGRDESRPPTMFPIFRSLTAIEPLKPDRLSPLIGMCFR